MDDAGLLAALKVNLGITGSGYDARLGQLIAAAKEAIAREGAKLNLQSFENCQIVIMYADWMWRKRDTQEPMPKMLRWQLNNLIFSQHMRGEADAD